MHLPHERHTSFGLFSRPDGSEMTREEMQDQMVRQFADFMTGEDSLALPHSRDAGTLIAAGQLQTGTILPPATAVVLYASTGYENCLFRARIQIPDVPQFTWFNLLENAPPLPPCDMNYSLLSLVLQNTVVCPQTTRFFASEDVLYE